MGPDRWDGVSDAVVVGGGAMGAAAFDRLADAGRRTRVATRWVVNAVGTWADGLNARFGVDPPWRQALSQGVSLCVRRPAGHGDTLVFDDDDEGYSLVPWGPVAVWGSTARPVASPEQGRRVGPADVSALLGRLNRHTTLNVTPADVVALRRRTRGLVVHRDAADVDPSILSKLWRAHVDRERPWITLLGGKITSSSAANVVRVIDRNLGRRRRRRLWPAWPCRPPRGADGGRRVARWATTCGGGPTWRSGPTRRAPAGAARHRGRTARRPHHGGRSLRAAGRAGTRRRARHGRGGPCVNAS